jgi:ABC-type Zn uptake system ZnuABC Zn-binding protein ZnuA
MKKRMSNINLFLLFIAILVLTACSTQADNTTAERLANGEKLKVVATTTIVGDVVSQVGDDRIDLQVLLPVGVDPHGFNPTPQDISKVADADLVFANGAGLEEFLDNLIESAGAKDKVIHVSDGIDFLVFEGQEQEHDHTGIDPHTWTDPNNVMVWVNNIEHELSINDPENADVYRANAKTYKAELQALDVWIHDQLARIPAENRKLVTDHALFGYFVEEYGLIQVGALIAGYSTLAEPTAKELAGIEDAIQDLNVKAIFVGNTVNPVLAERVTEDTGTALIYVYTGSLSESGDEAGTYIEYMRYNTSAFVDALAP